MLIAKLAWRNLWRKRKRTFISVSAVLFAVLCSILVDSIQQGTWNNMIDNVVNYYYGHAQIQKNEYWENPSIDETFQFTKRDSQFLSNQQEITHYIPRLESFALASSEENSLGIFIIGTPPILEDRATDLQSKLIEGQYFDRENGGVLLAEGVAKKMEISVEDTLVLISQGYHGVNAAGKFPVRGIIKLGPPDLNSRMVYMPLKEAQYFYGADSLVSSVSMILRDRNKWPEVFQELRGHFPEDVFVVKNWMDLLPGLVQAKELDRASAYVVYFILYTVISFGIYSTILMMIKERQYELGVMLALGMNRMKLSAVVWLETLFTGLIGVLAGCLVALPVVIYFRIYPLHIESMAEAYEKFGFEPYLPTAVHFNIFLTQAIIVFAISVVISAYPVSRILKMNIIQSLRA